MKKHNIYLIGLMGVGKTTIGKLLAKDLQLQFYDADAEIEKRSGAPIPWIFDLEGEPGFRQRENKIIYELTKKSGIVLATGGGAILNIDNRKALKDNGVVIYLSADLSDLIKRTARNQNRPLLLKNNPKAILEKLLQQREALYLEIADFIYDTSRHDLTEIINAIKKDINQFFIQEKNL